MTRPLPGSASNQPDLLTVAEVAARLKVERKKVYGLMAQGKIAFVRWDRTIRFHPADVDKFIQAARVGAKWEK